MNNDLNRTIHYTTKASQICANLIHYIPNEAKLIEPFVGQGDLLILFPNNSWEIYDVQNNLGAIMQDTLLNPPDYKNKYVITNPPYLAKNKAKDKTIFNKYAVDDLYKATLKSILDCAGGILIIPTNFITDEKTGPIRKLFLNQFKILEMNIFTRPVFDTTTYSVCSFAFTRKNNNPEAQEFNININPEGKKVNVKLYPEYDYRLAGEFYNTIAAVPISFSRLVGQTSNEYITHIKLYGLDTRTDRIRLVFEEEPYYGKSTDRIYATLTCKRYLNAKEEKILIDKFNEMLESFRAQYADLCLTNYRDYNRKRISFTFVYQLLSYILNNF